VRGSDRATVVAEEDICADRPREIATAETFKLHRVFVQYFAPAPVHIGGDPDTRALMTIPGTR
jgi:hypothetical protein